MADVAAPNFKQHKFAIPNAKPFTSETAREAGRKGAATQRENTSIKQALFNAVDIYEGRADKQLLAQARKLASEGDKLGLTVFFLELLSGSGEDRRAMLAMIAKMLPIEVQGALDVGLTVKVVSLVGGSEEILIPTDASPVPALPVALGGGGAPEDGRG